MREVGRKIVAMTRTISKTVMIFFCLSAVSSALIMFIAVRYSLTGDLTEFVLPWFTQLTQHGLQAISGASILTSTPIRLQGGKRNSRVELLTFSDLELGPRPPST